jgi:hypothetical protein
MTPEQLEALVLEHTSRLDMVDAIVGSNGQRVLAFRCSHSAGYFPANYTKEWGHTTGIGLGPQPVSECLDTYYHIAPPPLKDCRGRVENIMHPVGHSMAQIDLVEIPIKVYEANKLILMDDDPDMTSRIAIVRKKQDVNPKSQRKAYMAMFNSL